MFPLGAFLQVEEQLMVYIYKVMFQKFPLLSLLDHLRLMLTNYGNFGFEAVSTYEDITR